MADWLLASTASNLCLSAGLAVIAWSVHRTGKHPTTAHLLWLLVLIKLVTPPLFTLSLVPTDWLAEPALTAAPAPDPVAVVGPTATVDVAPSVTPSFAPVAAPSVEAITDVLAFAWPTIGWTDALLLAWGLGSTVLLAFALQHLVRFRRLLRASSRSAPAEVEREVQRLSRRFGLRSAPPVDVTTARVTPFLWSVGGPARIVLPEALINSAERDELRLVLAHEIAHVRRGDHIVRWLEGLTCVLFWWNPIVWLARRCLRSDEEVGCDALVLDVLRPNRTRYANSLLTVAEFLATPAYRPPVIASSMTGGSLETRLHMIVSDRLPRTPRWLRLTVLSAAACLLPLSVGYAQDFQAVERRLGAAVSEGEITLEQARAMMDTLREVSRRDRVPTPSVRASALETQREELDDRRAEYEDARARLEVLHDQGWITRADQVRQLDQLAEALDGLAERHGRAAANRWPRVVERPGQSELVDEPRDEPADEPAHEPTGEPNAAVDEYGRILDTWRGALPRVQPQWTEQAKEVDRLLEAGVLSPEAARDRLLELDACKAADKKHRRLLRDAEAQLEAAEAQLKSNTPPSAADLRKLREARADLQRRYNQFLDDDRELDVRKLQRERLGTDHRRQ